MRLVQDRIAVRRVDAVKTTSSGIVLTGSYSGEQEEVVVAFVGPGIRDTNGNLHPPTVQVGDTVIVRPTSLSAPFKVDGTDYYIISEANVVAVLD